LWSGIEAAFEWAPGGLVIEDLSAVTAFDQATVSELRCVARDAARRRELFRAVARQSGALAQYLRWSVHGVGLETYGSVGEAAAAVEADDLYRDSDP
jgi:hypothetical protein